MYFVSFFCIKVRLSKIYFNSLQRKSHRTRGTQTRHTSAELKLAAVQNGQLTEPSGYSGLHRKERDQ